MHVTIYTQAKSATQSGRGKTKNVVLECAQIGARAIEPLMGWTSAPDTLNQIKLTFDTVEAAVRHATREGWTYTIAPEMTRRVKPRNYTDNFKFTPPEEKKKA